MDKIDYLTTYVIDAGGRYGVHPTWKGFKGDLCYVVFEPDAQEAERLRLKYLNRAEITVVDRALHSAVGELELHVLRHKGLSSAHLPNAASDWFQGERAPEGEVVAKTSVTATTVDAYCRQRGLSVDFIKIDTEGHEHDVLLGAAAQLQDSLLGIRCETYFDHVFQGIELFPKIHEMLLDAGFFLLNLDYSGQGAFRNDFVRHGGRYGVLTGCDAVYLKRDARIFASAAGTHREVGARALKCAAFCFNNNASDVAFDLLLEVRRSFPDGLAACDGSALYRYVKLLVQRTIKDIQYQPGQSIEKLVSTFRYLFNDEVKSMHEFFESDELNPD